MDAMWQGPTSFRYRKRNRTRYIAVKTVAKWKLQEANQEQTGYHFVQASTRKSRVEQQQRKMRPDVGNGFFCHEKNK